jgi:hypothetical protein
MFPVSFHPHLCCIALRPGPLHRNTVALCSSPQACSQSVATASANAASDATFPPTAAHPLLLRIAQGGNSYWCKGVNVSCCRTRIPAPRKIGNLLNELRSFPQRRDSPVAILKCARLLSRVGHHASLSLPSHRHGLFGLWAFVVRQCACRRGCGVASYHGGPSHISATRYPFGLRAPRAHAGAAG